MTEVNFDPGLINPGLSIGVVLSKSDDSPLNPTAPPKKTLGLINLVSMALFTNMEPQRAKTCESQSKPGTKMVDPEPCKELRRRPQLYIAGIVPYQPSLTRVVIVAHVFLEGPSIGAESVLSRGATAAIAGACPTSWIAANSRPLRQTSAVRPNSHDKGGW